MELIMGGLRGLFGVKSAPNIHQSAVVKTDHYAMKERHVPPNPIPWERRKFMEMAGN
jgi:hypothetical protein